MTKAAFDKIAAGLNDAIASTSPTGEALPELVERLREQYTRIPGTGQRLINPDGPEAATLLQRYAAALEEIAEEGDAEINARDLYEGCKAIARTALCQTSPGSPPGSSGDPHHTHEA